MLKIRAAWLKLILFLLVAFLLVACNSTTSETISGQDSTSATATKNESMEESAAEPTESASTNQPEADTSTEAPEDGPASASEEEIMTEDNRSEQLRRLTASWNTDWTRHTIHYDEILSGGPPRDGIPSIDEPVFISQEEAAEWLADNEPVIAVEYNGDARAYPIQILTWHEIVNDTVGDTPVVVTFCPLCNSAIVFDRRVNGQTFEFGTSGLLRHSDLIMYDRTTESLWQQFTGEGIVGELAGEQLTFLPSSLVSFADFREAFPEGAVLSRDTGYDRSYGNNPYVGYDDINQSPFLYQGIPDDRLAPMERVVTVSLDDADVAFPLPLLMEKGVIQTTVSGQDMVVFHKGGTSSALDTRSIADGADVGSTGVFDPNLNGQTLTFVKDGEFFVDEQTNSTWNIFGEAIEGELAGETLEQFIHADHFWFSWAAFRPNTIIYR